jgi:hypothetical protein
MCCPKLSFSSSVTPNNFGFLLYFRILLFNFKIVCPGCCFNLENMLNSVLSQRKGLSIILGLPSTASLEAMEVMSGVIPLDFRREEIAIRDIGKIYSYSAKIFLLYFRILLFNFKIVCPGCCFNLENMLYSVLSALMLILHFLLYSIISLMSFCIHSETSKW